MAPPSQHLPSHSAGLEGDYRRPTTLPNALSLEEMKDAFKPDPVRKSELPLKDLVGSNRTPKWVTSNAASETFEFVEVIMRRFCQQQNAWAQAPLSWLCVCCRVSDLLIRAVGLGVFCTCSALPSTQQRISLPVCTLANLFKFCSWLVVVCCLINCHSPVSTIISFITMRSKPQERSNGFLLSAMWLARWALGGLCG